AGRRAGLLRSMAGARPRLERSYPGVIMRGSPPRSRVAARAASPWNRHLLGAIRRPTCRGRLFRPSRDTAAEWVKVPWADGTERERVAKWGGATTRPRS